MSMLNLCWDFPLHMFSHLFFSFNSSVPSNNLSSCFLRPISPLNITVSALQTYSGATLLRPITIVSGRTVQAGFAHILFSPLGRI